MTDYIMILKKIMKADKHLLFKMKEMWTYMSLNFDDSHKCAKLIRKSPEPIQV